MGQVWPPRRPHAGKADFNVAAQGAQEQIPRKSRRLDLFKTRAPDFSTASAGLALHPESFLDGPKAW